VRLQLSQTNTGPLVVRVRLVVPKNKPSYERQARGDQFTCSEMFVSIVDVFYQVPFQFGPESATFEVASELRVFAALTAQVSLQVPQILVGPSTVWTTIGFVAACKQIRLLVSAPDKTRKKRRGTLKKLLFHYCLL
jgi:hypothetical protein